jgi:hypothetical protein
VGGCSWRLAGGVRVEAGGWWLVGVGCWVVAVGWWPPADSSFFGGRVLLVGGGGLAVGVVCLQLSQAPGSG